MVFVMVVKKVGEHVSGKIEDLPPFILTVK